MFNFRTLATNLLIPKLGEKSFFLSIWYVIYIFTFQQFILPKLTGWWLPVEILAPYLVLSFIILPLNQSVVMLATVALLYETCLFVPVGTYFCGFWVIFAVLTLTKRALSWHHFWSWIVPLVVSLCWLSLFEGFIVLLGRDPQQIDVFFFSHELIRIIIGSMIGIGLATPQWLRLKGTSAGSFLGAQQLRVFS